MILIDTIPTCVPETNLKQTEIPAPTFYPGYLTECTRNEDCRDSYLSGLTGPLERLFSCHICKQEGYIPFTSVRTEG